MRPHLQHRAIVRGLIVPDGEIELYLMLGWTLGDEPHCSGARMLPPNCFAEQTPTEGVSRETRSRAA
jgi:hypothetical protein